MICQSFSMPYPLMRASLQRSVAEDELRARQQRLAAEQALHEARAAEATRLSMEVDAELTDLARREVAALNAAHEERLQHEKDASDRRWRQQARLEAVAKCRRLNAERRARKRSPTPPLPPPEEWLEDVRPSSTA